LKVFFIRSLSGIIYAALIIGSIFSGPIVFGILMLVGLILSLSELHNIAKISGVKSSRISLFLFPLIVYLMGFLIILGLFPIESAIVLLIVIFTILLIQLFNISDRPFEKTGILLVGIFYISTPMLLLTMLFYNNFHS